MNKLPVEMNIYIDMLDMHIPMTENQRKLILNIMEVCYLTGVSDKLDKIKKNLKS